MGLACVRSVQFRILGKRSRVEVGWNEIHIMRFHSITLKQTASHCELNDTNQQKIDFLGGNVVEANSNLKRR